MTRSAAHHKSVEALESRITPATVTAHWIGGSGNWTDPTHWDIGVVPNNVLGTDYDAILDATGAPTITIVSAIALHSIVAHDALTVVGGSLDLEGGVSTSDVTFAIDKSTLTVNGGAATFTATGPTQVVDSSLYAKGGGKLTLSTLTSYAPGSDGVATNVVWHAEGSGSVLNLGNLTSLSDGTDEADRVTIEAVAGGKIDLHKVTSLLVPTSVGGENARFIDVTATGGSSTVDLTALTGFQDFTQANSHLTPSSGGTITAPVLASIQGVTITLGTGGGLSTSALATARDSVLALSGGAFAFPALTSAIGTDISSTGSGLLNLAALTDLTRGSLSLAGGATANVNALSNINSASFSVAGGVTLALSAVTSYAPGSDGVATNVVWHAEGSGSVLNLGNLTSLSDGTDEADRVTIEAVAGGKIDLHKVTSLLVPTSVGGENARFIDVTATGGSSTVDLTALTGFQDFTQANSHLTPSSGGTITAPVLASIQGVTITLGTGGGLSTSALATARDSVLALSGGAFAFPALTSAIGTDISSTGSGLLNLAALTDLTRGSLSLAGGATANVNALSNINSASFSVAGGVTLALSAVTSYAPGSDGVATNVVWHAEGSGSVLNLGNLTSLSDGTDEADRVTIEAVAGGKIDLHKVTSLLVPTSVGGENARFIDVTATGGSSTVDLTALTGFQDFTQANSHLTPSSGGTITAPVLASIQGVTITLGTGGGLSTSALATARDSVLALSGGAFAFPALTSAIGTDISSTGSGLLNLAALTDLTRGSLSLAGGATANVNALSNINSASFSVAGGVTLALSAVTSYAPGSDGVATNVVWHAEGSGSVLNLGNLTSLSDGTDEADRVTIEAVAGGKIDLHKVTSLLVPTSVGGENARFIDVTATGGSSTVDLTALTGFQDFTQANSHLTPSSGGTITAPVLASIQGVTITLGTGGGLSTSALATARDSVLALSGGAFAFPALTSAIGTDISSTGSGLLNLAALTDLTRGSLSLAGGATANVNALSNINSASFSVAGGVTLALSAVTSYAPGSDGVATNVVWHAEGSGSVLNLGNLTSLSDGTDEADRVTIEAVAGGKIDLHKVTSLLVPTSVGGENARFIDVTATGGSSTVDLTALTGFQDFNGSTSSHLTLDRNGVINTPKLTTLQNVVLVGYSNTVTLDKLHPTLNFLDSHGTRVTLSFSGPGTATIQRSFDARQFGDLIDIDVTGTTAATTLKINAPASTHTALPALEVHGSIGTLTAPGVDFSDHLTIDGTAKVLALGNLTGGADLTISGQLLSGGTVVTVGTVTGTSQFTSASPLTTLQAANWLSGSITAPSITALKITGVVADQIPGDFAANLTLGDGTIITPLGSASVAGSISGGTWTIDGNVGSIAAGFTGANWTLGVDGTVQKIAVTKNASGKINAHSLGIFTVGGNLTQATVKLSQDPAAVKALGTFTVGGTVDHVNVNADGNIGAITVGAIRASNILAGISATSVGLPDAAPDFALDASIASITVKGIAGNQFNFTDTDIAARNLGTVVVRDIATANASVTFGLAANKIASFTFYQGAAVAKKATNLTSATNTPAYQVGDFIVRTI